MGGVGLLAGDWEFVVRDLKWNFAPGGLVWVLLVLVGMSAAPAGLTLREGGLFAVSGESCCRICDEPEGSVR